ncbi:GNAT family N-acetyltransferase [Paenibacillus sp. BK720]|uniref:GNAT family N-acetyltransferase n=1 Tax=Paenibacillus sp. BK720 TaxID=2587092 RepID=UPI001421E0E3|nr:GNAT family N-acetyltransferase [Paenibacillus sp. BK720]NIK72499.1 GNAT superfamily N-acetyltransferase [Paenibacillus sp. BK720]
MGLQVKNVSENELPHFVSILCEAAAWLKSEGKEMWKVEQLTLGKLLSSNSMNELFIGYIDNQAAAAMILQCEDTIFWPDAVDDSLFLHKLAVRRRFAKNGISAQMINWAKSLAKDQKKKYLRLDCAADRPSLCRFYEMQGFRKVSEKVMFDFYPTAFYEIDVT